MPNGRVWRSAVEEKKALALKRQPTTVRVCLRCEARFRSSGADHRLCNPCKGLPNPHTKVGARLAPGRRVVER